MVRNFYGINPRAIDLKRPNRFDVPIKNTSFWLLHAKCARCTIWHPVYFDGYVSVNAIDDAEKQMVRVLQHKKQKLAFNRGPPDD